MTERAATEQGEQPWLAFTHELQRGWRVKLPGGIVRTVEVVSESPWINERHERLYVVVYEEPASSEWGPGNTALAETVWVLVPKKPDSEHHNADHQR